MTLSISMEGSKNGEEIYAIIHILPSNVGKLSGFHYVFLIDKSVSMVKEGKLEKALQAVEYISSAIPSGNYISVYFFSKDLEKAYEDYSGKKVKIGKIGKGYTTNLHKALEKLLTDLKYEQRPTKVILLSDGNPTDKRDVKDYENLIFPSNVEVITIGLGKDYNEKILSKIAENNSGSFYHIEDLNVLDKIFEMEMVGDLAGIDVNVDLSGLEAINVKPFLPFVSNEVKIYAKGKGSDFPEEILVTACYYDPVKKDISIASSSLVVEERNEKVEKSVKLFEVLKNYSGNKQELIKLAEEVGRNDLVEEIRKLSGDMKNDLSIISRLLRKG